MKVFLLRVAAIAVCFPAAALTIVFAAQYFQEFRAWLGAAMGWDSGDAGYFTLALIGISAVCISGMVLLIASVAVPIKYIKSKKRD